MDVCFIRSEAAKPNAASSVTFSKTISARQTRKTANGAVFRRRRILSPTAAAVSLLRLAGIAGLMVTVHPVTLDRWVVVYLLTTLLGMVYALAKGSQLWGRPSTDLTALREHAAEGVF